MWTTGRSSWTNARNISRQAGTSSDAISDCECIVISLLVVSMAAPTPGGKCGGVSGCDERRGNCADEHVNRDRCGIRKQRNLSLASWLNGESRRCVSGKQ